MGEGFGRAAIPSFIVAGSQPLGCRLPNRSTSILLSNRPTMGHRLISNDFPLMAGVIILAFIRVLPVIIAVNGHH